jgi:hypothetical protein
MSVEVAEFASLAADLHEHMTETVDKWRLEESAEEGEVPLNGTCDLYSYYNVRIRS